jgi:photosystem II stability/assembly factor-like uncharacterized protein
MKTIIITFIYATILGTGFTQTWNQVTVPTSENLNDIEFPEGTTGTGYIGGDNGVLLKTIDGGLSWFNVDYTGIDSSEFNPLRFVDLEFVSDEVGYTTFGYDLGWNLYKTIDGGLNWTEIIPPADIDLTGFCYKNTLEVIDENHFFIGGRGCFMGPMIVEFNNGEWSLKEVDTDFFNSGVYVKDIKIHGDLGIASTHSSELLRTTDGGQSWTSIASPIQLPEDYLTDVIIINDTVMYAGMNNSGPTNYVFFGSTDSGATWSETFPGEGDMIMYASWHTFAQSTSGVLYASASSDNSQHFIHASMDGAWSYESIDEKIVSISSFGLNTTVGVGANGYVIINEGTTGTHEQATEAKIYPNPAMDVVTLKIEGASDGSIRIFDLLGAEVYHAPAKNQTTINISTWKPGVYTLKLENTTPILIKKFIKN